MSEMLVAVDIAAPIFKDASRARVGHERARLLFLFCTGIGHSAYECKTVNGRKESLYKNFL
jgi:hypothetical protein